MAAILTCPECDATLKLAAEPAPGKKVKCPKCEAIFEPEGAETRRVSAERPVAPARRRPEDDDADDDREERRPRRPRKVQGNGGLMIGLLVGGGVLVLLLLTCGVGGAVVWFLASPGSSKAQPAVAKNAQVNNPAPAANNPAPPPAAGNNNAAPPPAGGNNAAPPPADPLPGAPPANPPMAGGGGNPPGNNAYPVVLSNARVSRRGARMTVSLHYKYVQPGPKINVHVVIKSGGGNSYRGDLFGMLKDEDTLDLSGITFGGIDRGPYEIYLETGIGRLGPHQQISNSITVN
jgi:hypothetical protein